MKEPSSLSLIFLIVISCISCKNENVVNCPNNDLRSLNYDFESSLDDWVALGGKIEIVDSASFSFSTEIVHNGIKSGKFTVSPDDFLNNGVRAELSFDQLIESGDETFYEYSIFIPLDYQDIRALEQEDGTPNWQILGQWHDQPDQCVGETWDDIAGNSPPIAIYYNFLTKSDPNYLDILSDPNLLNIFGVDTTWNNVSTLSLVYKGNTIGIAEIEKGKWTRLKFNIKWSMGNDGFVQGWIDNNPLTDGKVMGSNMLNNASHYFKFGLYRNASIPFTNSIYYDDVIIY